MSEIKRVSRDDLRRMEGREGLILQGCGGELEEWLDGINDLLTEEGILLNGSRFQTASEFQHDGMTNLLFDFEGAELNIGKLAMWRLQTHGQFGGTWLSDYVPNKLGGFVQGQKVEKPDCPLIGEDSNIFNLIGIVSRTLREHGLKDQVNEMRERITGGDCHSYSEALNIIGDYVNITSQDTQTEEMDMTWGGM